MVILSTFSIIEIGSVLIGVIGALGLCMSKSRCSDISCCGIKCKREVLTESELQVIEPNNEENSDFDNALNIPRT